ncbi:hypothetical protein BKA62DRAFT_668695 [Auriculariales sp. MPI-PUGE-AT-0066]|nr:hypothetical protein BKA62DRAFT_668695 [Auriculariales sp. MPI-PUGE-AT-0066]
MSMRKAATHHLLETFSPTYRYSTYMRRHTCLNRLHYYQLHSLCSTHAVPSTAHFSRSRGAHTERVPSFLEAWDSAYQEQQAQGHAADVAAATKLNLPCDHLRELVVNGEYERANTIRIEYGKQGIPIAMHPIYEEAAIHAYLRRSVKEQEACFEDWWQLVPDRALCPGGRSFDSVIEALIRSGNRHIPTLGNFVRMAASKGWVRDIQDRVLPTIVRYAVPSTALAALADALDNAHQYSETHSDDPTVNAWYSATDLISAALRSAIIGGRRNLACMIVELAFLYEVSPTPYQLAFFLRQLSGPDNAVTLARARQLIADNYWLVKQRPDELEAIELAPKFMAVGPLYYPGPLAKILRMVKNTTTSNSPPRATAIAHLLARYVRLGRTRVLRVMRKKVITRYPSLQAASLWYTAEMKFWHIYGRHDRVLDVYRRVFKRIRRQPLHTRRRMSNYAKHLDLPPIILPWRIHPSAHTQVLVWSSLARLKNNLNSLSGLYEQFLGTVDNFIAARDHVAGLKLSANDEDASESLPPALMPDSAAFTPFVIRFARLGGPKRGLSILRDMSDRHITPSQHTWFFAMRAFALAGDVAGLYEVLGAVERLGAPDWTQTLIGPQTLRHRFGPITTPLVFPCVPFYQLALRLLVRKRRYQEVAMLITRIEDLGWRPGNHPKFDRFVATFKQHTGLSREDPPTLIPIERSPSAVSAEDLDSGEDLRAGPEQTGVFQSRAQEVGIGKTTIEPWLTTWLKRDQLWQRQVVNISRRGGSGARVQWRQRRLARFQVQHAAGVSSSGPANALLDAEINKLKDQDFLDEELHEELVHDDQSVGRARTKRV